MIRFRIGQGWKREKAPSLAVPIDSFGLLLDGVDLLAGASNEPLLKVVSDWAAQVARLWRQGEVFGEISMPEAHLETLLERQGSDLRLSVVSLARPARQLRTSVRVDLAELAEAVVRCAKELHNDLRLHAPKLGRSTDAVRMMKAATQLENAPIALAKQRSREAGFGYQTFVSPGTVGFELSILDVDDALILWRAGKPGALSSLLVPGGLKLREADGTALWQTEGSAFLLALELSRQAGDLVTALEHDEPEFSFRPGGQGSSLTLHLKRHEAEIEGRVYPFSAGEWVNALYDVGLSFGFAVTRRNRKQRQNPYVAELLTRCHEGLAHWRHAVSQPAAFPPSSDSATKPQRSQRKRASDQKPLTDRGTLRRLKFALLWEKSRLGAEAGQLQLSPKGPVFSGAEMACAFSPKGQLRFRRVSTHGVAISAKAHALTASASRLVAYSAQDGSARWLRDHDGTSLGPLLIEHENQWLVELAGRGAAAFDGVTGRELWRVLPPRAQRTHISLWGRLALLTSDSGFLYGIGLDEGQVRFQIRAAYPFLSPAVPWGTAALCVLGRTGQALLLAADPQTGTVLWTHELALNFPSRPIAHRARAFVAGERDGHAVLFCFNAKGKVLWERRLSVGSGPLSLLATPEGVVATGRAGATALVSWDGTLRWVVGASGLELPKTVAPRLVRQLLVVAGEYVRAIELHSGRVLGKVKAGSGLCDLALDTRLNLYLLDEEGGLKAFHLASHFAVVSAER